MPAFRITDTETGESHILDPSRLMFSEADALEREWGIKLPELQVADMGKNLRVLGGFIWLMHVRAAAAERGIGFRKAAEEMPAAEFDFNLGALTAEEVEENPTGGPTSGPQTRTRRPASGKAATRTRTAGGKS
jgi:hypothetical protein